MKNEPPTKLPDHSELERLKSLVIVNTGDGKGKSTSAFGVIFCSTWKKAGMYLLTVERWETETAMAKNSVLIGGKLERVLPAFDLDEESSLWR